MRNLLLSGLTILCARPVLRAQNEPHKNAQNGPDKNAQKGPDKNVQNGPVYKVDPFWPKPLPHKWSMQQIVDIYVDRNDHIWILNRQSDARPDDTGPTPNH